MQVAEGKINHVLQSAWRRANVFQVALRPWPARRRIKAALVLLVGCIRKGIRTCLIAEIVILELTGFTAMRA